MLWISITEIYTYRLYWYFFLNSALIVVMQAVQEYYYFMVKKAVVYSHLTNLIMKPSCSAASHDLLAFDEGSVVVVTESDLEGYDANLQSGAVGNEIWADLSVVYRVRVAGQAALARISCLWLRCHASQKISGEKLGRESSCSITADHLGGISVDIQVY